MVLGLWTDDESPKGPDTVQPSTKPPSPATTSVNGSSSREPERPAMTLETSLVSMPDDVPCRQLFDTAMGCQGIGGTFRNGYRYGTWPHCSNAWSDFWFCMRQRGKPEAVKKANFQEHWWQKEEEFRRRPNSEDVWEERNKFERNKEFIEQDPEKGIWADSRKYWAAQ